MPLTHSLFIFKYGGIIYRCVTINRRDPYIRIPTEDCSGDFSFDSAMPSSFSPAHPSPSAARTSLVVMPVWHDNICIPKDTVDSAKDFELGLHVAALVAILITSTFGIAYFHLFGSRALTLLGALFPVVANRSKRIRIPSWVLFSIKHFGTGVIIATAFIHVKYFVPCDQLILASTKCI